MAHSGYKQPSVTPVIGVWPSLLQEGGVEVSVVSEFIWLKKQDREDLHQIEAVACSASYQFAVVVASY